MIKTFYLQLLALLPLADVVVLIRNGVVQVKRGEPKPGLIGDLMDVFERARVADGCIYAHRAGSGWRLRFFGLPPSFHQRLRNVWAAAR
ncbi:MAG: hypothetical protein ACYTGH_14445 [Planctomycetota bacterium]